MSSQPPHQRTWVDLADVPAGLAAHARLRVTRRDGQTVARTDRRRRLRYDWVELRAVAPIEDLTPRQLYDRTCTAMAANANASASRDADAAFVLDASRRSRTAVGRRFGQATDTVAHALARLGVVTLVCDHQDGRLGSWHHWELSPELVAAVSPGGSSDSSSATMLSHKRDSSPSSSPTMSRTWRTGWPPPAGMTTSQSC